jgi:ornithine carbamoyltransferase
VAGGLFGLGPGGAQAVGHGVAITDDDDLDAIARQTGGSVGVVADPREAVAGARAVYTDVWVSMGDADEEAERLRVFSPYRVDEALMDAAAPDAIALHPLPAHDGLEITRAVYHGPRSAVWDEAENRLHVQAALLMNILG